jgi:hypothetical protein
MFIQTTHFYKKKLDNGLYCPFLVICTWKQHLNVWAWYVFLIFRDYICIHLSYVLQIVSFLSTKDSLSYNSPLELFIKSSEVRDVEWNFGSTLKGGHFHWCVTMLLTSSCHWFVATLCILLLASFSLDIFYC